MIISTLLPKCQHEKLKYIYYQDKWHVTCSNCRAIFDVLMADSIDPTKEFDNTGNLSMILNHIIAQDIPVTSITKEQLWYLINIGMEIIPQEQALAEYERLVFPNRHDYDPDRNDMRVDACWEEIINIINKMFTISNSND